MLNLWALLKILDTGPLLKILNIWPLFEILDTGPLLKIFDIGIAAAFGTTALALIVLFWKLLTKTKHVKENCHELQTFLQ